MNHKGEIELLVRKLRSGGISRREFVSRAAAFGLSVGTIGMVLTACGGSRDEVKTTRAPATDLGPIEKELNIYNWSDYIAEDTLPNFEKEFGVAVTYDNYESNEEMLAKLETGAAAYDIVVPSGYSVQALLAANLLEPVSRQYLTNWSNIAPIFLDPPFDPGNDHTVPWQWGTSGIAYRTDKVSPPPDSWSVFHDEKYRRRMTQMDDEREVIGSWLRYRGHSLNSTDPGELDAAKADALAARKNVKEYLSAPVKQKLISGEVWIAQLWNGDTAQAKLEQSKLSYVLPKEGCTIWTDSLAIPRTAPHKRAAHEFMNYILRPEVGAAISNFTGYGTPNRAALAAMKAPVPYPTADEIRRLEYQKDLGAGMELWDQIWTEIRS